MKNVKKYLTLILTVVVMLAMLTACGKTENENNNEAENNTNNTNVDVSTNTNIDIDAGTDTNVQPSQVVIPDDYTEYKDSSTGLRFAYPSNWINAGTDQIPVFGDTITGATVNLVTESITKGTSLSTYATASKSAVESAFTIDGTIKEEKTQVNGVDVVKLTYNTTQSGIDMTLQQVLMVKDDKAYVITFGSQTTSFDDVKDTFDKILSTVQL